MKRGYDDHYGGRGRGPPPPGFKKYRRDDVDPVNPTPSKVLHIRNLTQETTEADLLSALSHFGNVAYTTLMANGHMALAEFATMDQARACIAYSKNHQIMVRNHPVLINYSTSEKIQRSGLESEDPCKVIVLTISNVTYPITVDILKEICSEHGKVLRIALIKKPGNLQALVEFEDAEQATKAKYGLNGADIYDNACTLKVEFGKMNMVKVSANTSDQWDYTGDPALNQNNDTTESNDEKGNGRNEYDQGEESTWRRDRPPRHDPDPSFTQPNSYGGGGGYIPNSYESNYRGRGSSSYRGSRGRGGTYNPESGGRGGYSGPTENFFNDRSNYDNGYSRGGSSYRGSRGSLRGGPPPSSWNERSGYEDRYDRDRDSRGSDYYERSDYGHPSRGSRGGSWRGGHDRPHREDRYEGHNDYDRDRDRGHYDRHSDDRGSRNAYPPNGAVVMVYGINPVAFSCDRLFNLLCCYGNCLKIKYMHSKPDTCMVQMGNSEEATAVIEHLQDCEVFGTRLSFRPSKQNIVHDVREPHTLSDGTPAFRDYTSSSVHRFSTPQMAEANKIVYPNQELFWYNAPPIMSEEVMKKLFTQKQAPVPIQVTLLESTTSSSGLLRFNSTPEASEALMICNNMVIAGGSNAPPFVFKLSYAAPEHKR